MEQVTIMYHSLPVEKRFLQLMFIYYQFDMDKCDIVAQLVVKTIQITGRLI